MLLTHADSVSSVVDPGAIVNFTVCPAVNVPTGAEKTAGAAFVISVTCMGLGTLDTINRLKRLTESPGVIPTVPKHLVVPKASKLRENVLAPPCGTIKPM